MDAFGWPWKSWAIKSAQSCPFLETFSFKKIASKAYAVVLNNDKLGQDWGFTFLTIPDWCLSRSTFCHDYELKILLMLTFLNWYQRIKGFINELPSLPELGVSRIKHDFLCLRRSVISSSRAHHISISYCRLEDPVMNYFVFIKWYELNK